MSPYCFVRWFLWDMSLWRIAAVMLQQWWRRRRVARQEYEIESSDEGGATLYQVGAAGDTQGYNADPPPGAALDRGVWGRWLEEMEKQAP